MYSPLNTLMPLIRMYELSPADCTFSKDKHTPHTWPLQRIVFNYKYGESNSHVIQARMCYGAWPQCCAAHYISGPGVFASTGYTSLTGQSGSAIKFQSVPHVKDFIPDEADRPTSTAGAVQFGYDMLAQVLACMVIRSGHTVFATDRVGGQIERLIRIIEQYQGLTTSKPFLQHIVPDRILGTDANPLAWQRMMGERMLTSGRIIIKRSKIFHKRTNMTMFSLSFTRGSSNSVPILPTEEQGKVIVKKMLSKAYTDSHPSYFWGHA